VTDKIKIDGRTIAPLRRKIHAMRERAGNLIPAWNELIGWFADQERLQFGSRGQRWHSAWPELARSTVADKRAAGYTGDILVRETDLLRSLTDRPLSVERMTTHEAVAGASIRYARFHQRGTKHMPARKLIDAGVIAEEGAASEAVASWIVRGEPRIR
jgi:phage gpG-like protein